MRCPKCGWVGFERLPRCRHCGYDFSLAREPLAEDTVSGRDGSSATDVSDVAAGRADVHDGPLPATVADWLPLFESAATADSPARRVPSPRAPLSVRRTTSDLPRLKTRPVTARQSRQVDAVPALRQSRRTESDPEGATGVRARGPARPVPARPEPSHLVEPETWQASEPGPRFLFQADASDDGGSGVTEDVSVSGLTRAASMAVDSGVMAVVVTAVWFLTLGIAGLPAGEWRTLPLVPLAAFLVLFAVAYHAGFTASGGQTLGKMLTGLQVVPVEGTMHAGRAIGRAVLAIVGLAVAGLGIMPALVTRDGRALHDRLSGTRVVRVR